MGDDTVKLIFNDNISGLIIGNECCSNDVGSHGNIDVTHDISSLSIPANSLGVHDFHFGPMNGCLNFLLDSKVMLSIAEDGFSVNWDVVDEALQDESLKHGQLAYLRQLAIILTLAHDNITSKRTSDNKVGV